MEELKREEIVNSTNDIIPLVLDTVDVVVMSALSKEINFLIKDLIVEYPKYVELILRAFNKINSIGGNFR